MAGEVFLNLSFTAEGINAFGHQVTALIYFAPFALKLIERIEGEPAGLSDAHRVHLGELKVAVLKLSLIADAIGQAIGGAVPVTNGGTVQ